MATMMTEGGAVFNGDPVDGLHGGFRSLEEVHASRADGACSRARRGPHSSAPRSRLRAWLGWQNCGE
jgi:hypothetical protein